MAADGRAPGRDPIAPTSACGNEEDRDKSCGVSLGVLLAYGRSGALEVDQGRGANRLGLGMRACGIRLGGGDEQGAGPAGQRLGELADRVRVGHGRRGRLGRGQCGVSWAAGLAAGPRSAQRCALCCVFFF